MHSPENHFVRKMIPNSSPKPSSKTYLARCHRHPGPSKCLKKVAHQRNSVERYPFQDEIIVLHISPMIPPC